MEYEKIILDLMQRVIELEKEVKVLKAKQEASESETDDYEEVPKNDWPGVQCCYDLGLNIRRNQTVGKDKTRYMLNGIIYPKNRLVLAVVSDYVKKHPNITKEELKEVFNKSLQGSIGVVEDLEVAKRNRFDYERRFFAQLNEVLNVADGKMIVCTQWGITNIGNFLFRARMLGYEIQEIK